LQKLTRFTEAIKENPEIWQVFNELVKTSETVELDKYPVIKKLIDEIFYEKEVCLYCKYCASKLTEKQKLCPVCGEVVV